MRSPWRIGRHRLVGRLRRLARTIQGRWGLPHLPFGVEGTLQASLITSTGGVAGEAVIKEPDRHAGVADPRSTGGVDGFALHRKPNSALVAPDSHAGAAGIEPCLTPCIMMPTLIFDKRER